MKPERLLILAGAGLGVLAVLTACASFPTMSMAEREAAAERRTEAPTPAPGRGGDLARGQPSPMTIPGAGPSTPPPPEATPEQLATIIRDEPLNATLPPQPLAQFLNTVFMDVLRVPYTLGPGIGARTEIITINAPQNINKRTYALMLRNTLRDYGLVMTVQGNAIQIVETGAQISGGRGGLQVVRSRSSADTPAGNRQVIQFFQLVALQADAVLPFVNDTLLRGTQVTASSDPAANALLLSGPARNVAAAVDMLRNLDKPAFAGSQVVRLEPVFWAPDLYAQALVQTLSAEGFIVASDPLGPKSIMVLPLPSTSQVLVFAADRETMARVMYWARELDTPSSLGDSSTTFVYDVRNTSASTIAQIVINAGISSQGGQGRGGGGINNAVNQALGLPGGPPQQGGRGGGPQQNFQQNQGGRGGGQQNQAGRGGQQNQAGRGGVVGGRGGAVAGAAPGGGAIAVDDSGNRILFTGTASQFASLRQLLARLDAPARQVVVEVTVAEVTLTDETRSGVEFFIDALNSAGERYSGGTMGVPVGVPGSLRSAGPSFMGRGSSGLNLFFDRPNDYNIALNAIASNSKVNILSRPRLVARSGAAAYIQVGADVPIVIGQAAVNTGTTNDGALNVQQQIQYRQTGVILNITPVIYGEDRVDVIVGQEVSSARDNPNPAIQSPIIDNRNVSTTLSLADGQMAVLGGLVEDNFTKTNNGIPFLKDIPILGFPFRVDSVSGRKTELVVLITPFIIRDDNDMTNMAVQMAREMNNAFTVGRGGSYTLTPYGAGISVGLNPPSPMITGGGLRRPSSEPPP